MPNNDTGPTEQDAMFQIFREIFDESRSIEPIVIPNDLKDVIEKIRTSAYNGCIRTLRVQSNES